MKNTLRIGLAPLTALFYWLGGFIPRRRKRWIFGSYSNAFNDNSKYLYVHVVENHPEIEAIWITGNPKVRDHIRSAGGKALLRWSVKGLWACLTGRYWFVSAYIGDINYYCSRNATLINLWHGIPLKKIEFDIEKGPLAERFQRSGFIARNVLYPALFRRPDYVLSTSTRVTRDSLSSAFRIKKEQCWALGYPRNDLFFKSTDERLRIVKRWGTPATLETIEKIKKYTHCLIYMPTWRDTNPKFILDSGWNFQLINKKLKEKNILLLMKLHVATPKCVLRELNDLTNICLMESTDDIYSVLPHTSGLITDYSSIMFDYMLLDKPIFYYPFDRREYEQDARGFYYGYDDSTPGFHIETPSSILERNIESDEKAFRDSRRSLCESLFEHADSYASDRIVKKVQSLHLPKS